MHSEEGVAALVRRLLALEVARIAIEQPNGLVVDRLLEAGVTVVVQGPRWRPTASRRRSASAATSLILIPSRACLNVAVAGSVVMYDRVAKQTQTPARVLAIGWG